MPKRKPTKRFKPSQSRFSPLRIANFVLLFSIVGAMFVIISGAAPVAGMYGSVEKDQMDRVNNARYANGRASLQHIECLNTIAENWTRQMVSAGGISHNPNLAGNVNSTCGNSWSLAGENVGVGYSSINIFNAFMGSPLHKANITDSRFTKAGMGAYWSPDGRLFITQVFATCLNCGGTWATGASLPSDPVAPVAVPAPTEYTHLLRNVNSGGSANVNFKYGISTYHYLYCDWDGNGTDTVGMYYNGTWYIRNSNTSGAPDITLSYGYAGAKPVCGDWDGNGTDTVGIYVDGNWSLRNSNTAGSPNITFAYGYGAAAPVVGDWDGNGTDTVGIYVDGNWSLRNSNNAGSPNIAFAYGTRGYMPVVGDWDGNRTSTVGVLLK